MDGGLLLARIVHILGACIWIGGTVFLAAVAVPYARTLDEKQRTAVVTALGRRFRPVAWFALALSVGSGLYTMQKFGLLNMTALQADPHGQGLLIKVALAGVIIVLAALHDFVLGPRYERSGRGRRPMVILARCNGVVSVLVLALGVLLAH